MRVLVDCDARRLPFQMGELWVGGVLTDIAERIALMLATLLPDGTRGRQRFASRRRALEATRVRVIALR
jgi:hypothetical protein